VTLLPLQLVLLTCAACCACVRCCNCLLLQKWLLQQLLQDDPCHIWLSCSNVVHCQAVLLQLQ
jgi:hypothetical protein